MSSSDARNTLDAPAAPSGSPAGARAAPFGTLGRVRVASALRQALAQGYRGRELRADVLAGAVVGVIALPLSMALAIATGVPPQHGLYTAIVAGALVALLGGSRVQVTGPTAAFVAVLAPIVVRFGLGGLLVATVLAGLIQVGMGLARFGRLIELIPYPVTIGFTAGIAVVIATLQVKDFLGLALTALPEHWLEQVQALAAALPSARWPEAAAGAATLLLLKLVPRITHRVPAPLVALSAVAVACALLERLVPGFDVVTIRDRFTYSIGAGGAGTIAAAGAGASGASGAGIPQVPPLLVLPWSLAGPGGAPLGLSFHLVRELLPSAFAIAMLGAIESLLSAVVADGMTGLQHDPDAELVAQGMGNVAAPFFGGIAATGAIARTAANVRSGARSPVASIVHAAVVLLAVLLFAPALGHLPMAALAALLLLVAWNMGEARHVVHALRTSPRGDALVLVACIGLTIAFGMVSAVAIGLVLASLLFMRRMIDVSEVKIVQESHPLLGEELPRWLVYYEIAGPLFFGAAHRAMSALHRSHDEARVAVLDLSAVPVIDATGVVNLRSALSRLQKDGLLVVLTGTRPAVRRVILEAGLAPEKGRLEYCPSVETALAAAREHVARARAASGRVA